ncbi:MAG: histidinol dehydrogenase [Pseudomonadota bacterium]
MVGAIEIQPSLRLSIDDPNFDTMFNALLSAKREDAPDVRTTVEDIIRQVENRGDDALCELTERFDHQRVTPETLRITDQEIRNALGSVSDDLKRAIDIAATRIEAHHGRQLPQDDVYEDHLGVQLGTRWSAVDAAGLYVPGGTASYPSSVLMNAVPAKAAGVPRIVMVVPTPQGTLNPAVLAAADRAGVDEIYRVGGAQAIAALAFGTKTIAPVNKIVGPGNAYVAAAKRHVFGTVGIDMIAGPSEVLIIADATANPDWVAADLLAQAEHDVAAQAIVVTVDVGLADGIIAAVDRQLKTLERSDIARQSWAKYGATITVQSLDQAADLANRIAAEHLELAVEEPAGLAKKIRHAGAVFLGHHTPEAIGDYVGGTNHVLPTARSARFSSGLSVYDFLKRTSYLGCSADALDALQEPAITLAEAEGLTAHARSVAIRTNRR